MSLNTLFKEDINLFPEKPKTLWYVSAGTDFFPLVGYSEGFRADLTDEIKQITTPELFVYTCLGFDLPESVDKLFKSGILYKDNKVKITCNNVKKLHIDRTKYNYIINGNYINLFGDDQQKYDPLNSIGYDALYAKVRLEDMKEDYQEEFDLLYILGENINFYNEVVLKGHIDLIHLCAIREGCSFGGCRKSIITHIYKDNIPNNDYQLETITTYPEFTSINIKYSFLEDLHFGHKFPINLKSEIPVHAFMIGEGYVLKINGG